MVVCYDRWSILREVHVRAPMKDTSHYATSASMFFSIRDNYNPTKLQIHLAITSNRVVAETSNFDHR